MKYGELDRQRLDNNLSGFTWTNDDKSIFFAFFDGEVWFIYPEKDIFYARYQTQAKRGKLRVMLNYEGGSLAFNVEIVNDHRVIFKNEEVTIPLRKVASYKWL